MKRKLLVISNVLAFVSLLCLMGTGTILRWVLPPGSGGGGFGRGRGLVRGAGLGRVEEVKTFLGWGRHDWGDLHFWLAVAFVVIMTLHLILNWMWIKNTFFRRQSSKSANAE